MADSIGEATLKARYRLANRLNSAVLTNPSFNIQALVEDELAESMKNAYILGLQEKQCSCKPLPESK